MAPDPITQERVYRAIKDELLEARFRPGVRLDLQAIADRHRASTTPVREAIHRMIGEQLFEPHPEGGIRIALPDAAALRDLYAWNAQHLLATLRASSSSSLRACLRPLRDRNPGREAADLADFAAIIFRSVGEATGNTEFTAHIIRANARLHYARIAEARLFQDLARELRTLLRNGDIDVRTNLRRRVIAYHRRRSEHAVAIATEIFLL